MESLLLDTGKSVGNDNHVREGIPETVVWQFPDHALQNLGSSPHSNSSSRGENVFLTASHSSQHHVTDTFKRLDTHDLNLPTLEAWACYAPFNTIFYDESERYISTELQQGATLYSCTVRGELDVSPKTSWRLQRSFAKNVLPWIPLFDQEYCVEKVANASNSGFTVENTSVALVMFVLALGAISIDDENTKDDPAEFAGLGYFLKGCKIVGEHRSEANSLTMIQCQILWASVSILCASFDTFSDLC